MHLSNDGAYFEVGSLVVEPSEVPPGLAASSGGDNGKITFDVQRKMKAQTSSFINQGAIYEKSSAKSLFNRVGVPKAVHN